MVASHYSRLAMSLGAGRCPGISGTSRGWTWIPNPDRSTGRPWSLMGHYAAANHACIHRHVAGHLGTEVLLDLENHHNFAWKEKISVPGRKPDRKAVVHRKGATPGWPGGCWVSYRARWRARPSWSGGRAAAAPMNSAAHGAGRVMSRKRAIRSLNWQDANRLLRERGVTLMSAGLDEVPFVYKNIEEVMAAQNDLVEVVARFDPQARQNGAPRRTTGGLNAMKISNVEAFAIKIPREEGSPEARGGASLRNRRIRRTRCILRVFHTGSQTRLQVKHARDPWWCG